MNFPKPSISTAERLWMVPPLYQKSIRKEIVDAAGLTAQVTRTAECECSFLWHMKTYAEDLEQLLGGGKRS